MESPPTYGYDPDIPLLQFSICHFSSKFWCKHYMILTIPFGSSRQGEFHPKPLTEPYVIVSHHTALVVFTSAYSQPAIDKTFSDWITQFSLTMPVPYGNYALLSFCISLSIRQASDSHNLFLFERLRLV